MFTWTDGLSGADIVSMPWECAEQCHHQGRCDDDVEDWIDDPRLEWHADADTLRAVLREYGAWDAEELADDDDNRRRVLWIAAGDIQESPADYFPDPWRAPDVDLPGLAIWYGPGGKDGDCATVVEGYTVSEYQDATGYVDDIPDDGPYLVRSFGVDSDLCPDDPRIVARLGVEIMAERGADSEEWESALP